MNFWVFHDENSAATDPSRQDWIELTEYAITPHYIVNMTAVIDSISKVPVLRDEGYVFRAMRCQRRCVGLGFNKCWLGFLSSHKFVWLFVFFFARFT